MSWGNSFTSGLAAGGELRDKYKRQKFDEADQLLRKELADRQLTGAAKMHGAREQIERDKMEEDARRFTAEGVARENEPGEKLRRAKAKIELDNLGRTQVPGVPTAKVKRVLPGGTEASYEMPVTDLEKSFGAATPPPMTPALPTLPPTAKVTQHFGEGEKSSVSFNMPVEEARKMAGSTGYRSPYGDEIAALGGKIAENQSEIDGGDTRTGFLGIASSRKGIVDQATRQRRGLQAMELRDQLAKGVIDQAEADRRANLIMGVK